MIRPMARPPAQAIAANASAVRMCTFGIPFRFPADPPAFCRLANYKSAASQGNILVRAGLLPYFLPSRENGAVCPAWFAGYLYCRANLSECASTLISTTAPLCTTPSHDLSWPSAGALARIACCGRPRSASRGVRPSFSAVRVVVFAIGSWTIYGDAAGRIKPLDEASCAPELCDGKNRPLLFAARPERDYD